MNKNLALNALLSLKSIIISSVFVIVGFSAVDKKASLFLNIFGLSIGMYGLANLILLFVAWRLKQKYAHKLCLTLSIIFLCGYVIGSLDVGVISGLEWYGILVVAVLVFFNWNAIKSVNKYKGNT